METQSIITRAEYLAQAGTENAEYTHREYYAQFVTDTAVRMVGARFGEKLLASRDRYFNDIGIELWDKVCTVIHINVTAWKKAGNNGYSKSDLVCIAKAAGREYRKQRWITEIE